MKLSELIAELQDALQQLGDVDVEVCNEAGDLDFAGEVIRIMNLHKTVVQIVP